MAKRKRVLDYLTVKEVLHCAWSAAMTCEADRDVFIKQFGEYARGIAATKKGFRNDSIKPG
jgi:hypothetical protein